MCTQNDPRPQKSTDLKKTQPNKLPELPEQIQKHGTSLPEDTDESPHQQTDKARKNNTMNIKHLQDKKIQRKGTNTKNAKMERAGEKPPASAPKASQKSPRAQTAAKLKIPTLKQADSRQGDIVATGLRDGSMGAMPIHIYGKHSPPFRPTTHDTATHATRQWPLHPEGPMASPPLAHMY